VNGLKCHAVSRRSLCPHYELHGMAQTLRLATFWCFVPTPSGQATMWQEVVSFGPRKQLYTIDLFIRPARWHPSRAATYRHRRFRVRQLGGTETTLQPLRCIPLSASPRFLVLTLNDLCPLLPRLQSERERLRLHLMTISKGGST